MPRVSRAWLPWSLAILGVVGAPRLAEPPAERGAPNAWLGNALRTLAEREYAATVTERGLQAPNRAQGLRTYFAPEAVRIHDRTAQERELVELTLLGVGRGAELRAVAPGRVTSDGPRVEIRREELVEWYLNGAAGLEQGFTLAARPDGSGELALEVGLGGATATANPDGSLGLQSGAGRTLRYGELRAEDSRGRALPAGLELASSSRARILVDDSLASYPIVVDPLLTLTADTTLDSQQLGSGWGSSVSSAGDTNGDGYADVIVGAPFYDSGEVDEGAVFVFLGGAAGIANGGASSASALLQSNQPNVHFGGAVGAAGDVDGDGYADVIVGCYACGAASDGRAYIFRGGASGVQSGSLSTAASTLEGGSGNFAVRAPVRGAGDVNGDGYDDVLVALNNPLFTNPLVTADIWYGSAAGVPSGDHASAPTQINPFGLGLMTSVDAAGDVNGDGYDDIIVGEALSSSHQVAQVFMGTSTGLAITTPQTTLSSDQTGGKFGLHVAGVGDVNGDGYADVAVSDPSYDFANTDEGGVFVFRGGAAGIPSGGVSGAISLQSGVTSGGFGQVVESAGDVNGDGFGDFVVSDPGPLGLGSAWVFAGGPSLRSGTLTQAFAHLQSGQFYSLFGASVGSAGDVNGDGFDDLIVGAPGLTGSMDDGLAFVYLGGARGVVSSGPVSSMFDGIAGGSPEGGLGASVASAGDVNGDGYGDIVLGAPSYDFGQIDEGAAFVFLGKENGIDANIPAFAASAIIRSNQAGAALGSSVASAGDVNGDGYGDLIVGAPSYDSPDPNEGAAFLYLGSATGIDPANLAAKLESNQAGALFGASVAGLGDVNADGFGDLAVGAPRWSNGQTDEGGVFVFQGSLAGIGNGSPATASARLEGQRSDSRFGQTIAGAGDVNGDGFSDLLVGAPRYDEGQTDEGAAFVFHGSAAGIGDLSPATAATFIQGNVDLRMFANSVSGAGDVNRDGYADVIVGWSSFGLGDPNQGRALVFHGGPSGIPSGAATSVANATIDSVGPDMNLGASVAGVGDVNGDGYSDVAIGMPGGDLAVDSNAVIVLYGTPTGIPSGNVQVGIPGSTVLAGPEIPSLFGASVAGAGDVNGDGFADVIVGAPNADGMTFQEGVAYTFLGNAGGRGVRSRQRRGLAGTPVLQAFGESLGSSFTAEITGTHRDGRGRVSAQFEACPASAAFGSPSCASATLPGWTAVGPGSPAVLSQTFTGLAAHALYRWRARVLRTDDTGPLPLVPARGPWMRLGATLVEADVRAGIDTDGDGIFDAADNCPYVANPGQEDDGGIGATSGPDKIGNACQCGSVTGNGRIQADDVTALRQYLANPASPIAVNRCVVLGKGSPCNALQLTILRRALAVPPLPPITATPSAQACVAAGP